MDAVQVAKQALEAESFRDAFLYDYEAVAIRVIAALEREGYKIERTK